MKSILMSIQPKWVEKIISGEKTIEVRKTAPKEVPFKAYIYCTYGRGKGASALYFDAYGNVSRKANRTKWINGKVIGEFVCNKVETIPVDSEAFAAISKPACLTIDELLECCSGKDMYGLHISALKIYDKPKELSDFRKLCIMSEMPYCPACKFGNIQYSSDEVECFRDIEGASCEWLCTNFVKRPPQSWQYVREI